MSNSMVKSIKISENQSIILNKENIFVKYIKRNFPTALNVKDINNNTIITSNNCIGIIKKDNTEYRFYSKASDFLEVFRLLEKITFSDYKFKVDKTFMYFDPKEKIKVDNGRYILNLLIDIFIREVNKIKNIGLSKNYTKTNENLNYLKGRLDFTNHITKNIVPVKFYCTYNQMTYLTDENIILYVALEKISNSKYVTSIQKSKIITLKNEFSNILDNIDYRSITNKLKYKKTKLNSYYEIAISIAEMIMKGSLYSSLKEGDNIFCNFIVSTDTLFERYIFLLLNEIIQESYPQLSIKEQVDLNKMEKISKENKNIGYLAMNPDIVVYKNSIPILIIDTKYINLYGKTKLTNSVYYQMLSYLICMNDANSNVTPKGVLLAFGKEEANRYRLKYDMKSSFEILTKGIDILADEEVVKNQLNCIIKECIDLNIKLSDNDEFIEELQTNNIEYRKNYIGIVAEEEGKYE